MVSTTLLLVDIVSLLVTAGFLVLAAHTVRRNEGIGVAVFAALLSLIGVRLALGLFTTNALLFEHGDVVLSKALESGSVSGAQLGVALVLTGLNALVISGITATWVVFVIQYTTQISTSRRRLLAAVGGPVLVVFLPSSLLTVAVRNGLLTSEAVVLARDLTAISSRALVFGATLLGIVLLARVAIKYEYFPARLGAALAGAISIHVFFRAITQEFAPVLTIGTMLIVGTVLSLTTLGLFALATLRWEMFETVPVAGTVGPRVLFEEFEAPIVVVDRRGRITDLNPEAEGAFGVGDAIVGKPLDALLSTISATTAGERRETDIPGSSLPREISLAGSNQTLVPDVSTITDHLGRVVGHSVLFTDVTQARVREQRISVLNRVLRHNLRNDGNVIMGHISTLQAETSNDHAEKALEKLQDLSRTAEKARLIESLFDEPRTVETATPAGELLERAVERGTERWPDADVSIDAADIELRTNPRFLLPVLEELVQNACQHADSAARRELSISARHHSEGVTIRVTDQGPGIPNHEMAVFDADEETDLQHGSGLGLWLIRWSVERLGGAVTVDVDDGTTVTIQLSSEHVSAGTPDSALRTEERNADCRTD